MYKKNKGQNWQLLLNLWERLKKMKNLVKNIKKNYLAVLNYLFILLLVMVLPVTILVIYVGADIAQFDSLLVFGVTAAMIPTVAVNFFDF